MKWLLLLTVCLFSCNNGEVEIEYTPPLPPPIVAMGLLDGAEWEATRSSSIRNNELFNFGLDQADTPCPRQALSFQNVPLKEGTFPIQSTSRAVEPGVDSIYSFLFLACGDAIEGDYRVEEGALSSMTILSINENIVKGTFQVKYNISEGFNPTLPNSFELTDVAFEIEL